MKSPKFISIPLHSNEWYNFRLMNGVGASEIGTIMGLNSYKTSLKLFYEKIGAIPQQVKNVRMHIGHISEPIISDLFEYWELNNDVFLDNLNKKRKVRKLEELNTYCVNDDMPNVFASLDRRFDDVDGEYVGVELKNTSQMEYSKYETVNPCHLMQVATQIICSGYKGGYLATLVDNVRFEVLYLSYKEALSMKKAILSAVKTFWGGVLRARELQTQIYHAKNNYNEKLVAELEMQLLQCEPTCDNDMAFLEHLSERYKIRSGGIPMKGDDVLLQKARELKKIETKKKKLIESEAKIKADLVREMRKEDRLSIDFGKDGSVTFFNGTFKNKIK